MKVQIPYPLLTCKAPKTLEAPWLRSRATYWMVAVTWKLAFDDRWEEVPAGYIFDGSSIPWVIWWLFPPTYDPAWEAACWHDHCYSHLYHRISKKEADRMFYEIMINQGAAPWIAKLFYRAVHRFGRGGGW